MIEVLIDGDDGHRGLLGFLDARDVHRRFRRAAPGEQQDGGQGGAQRHGRAALHGQIQLVVVARQRAAVLGRGPEVNPPVQARPVVGRGEGPH